MIGRAIDLEREKYQAFQLLKVEHFNFFKWKRNEFEFGELPQKPFGPGLAGQEMIGNRGDRKVVARQVDELRVDG